VFFTNSITKLWSLLTRASVMFGLWSSTRACIPLGCIHKTWTELYWLTFTHDNERILRYISENRIGVIHQRRPTKNWNVFSGRPVDGRPSPPPSEVVHSGWHPPRFARTSLMHGQIWDWRLASYRFIIVATKTPDNIIIIEDEWTASIMQECVWYLLTEQLDWVLSAVNSRLHNFKFILGLLLHF